VLSAHECRCYFFLFWKKVLQECDAVYLSLSFYRRVGFRHRASRHGSLAAPLFLFYGWADKRWLGFVVVLKGFHQFSFFLHGACSV
jgi:hypothetical protein